MTNVAVVLAGNGYLDGAEIREAVITLLALDRAGANVSIFAPDMPQTDVVNHITGEQMNEQRNVMIEAARIARGQIKNLIDAKADNFDALVLPGGYGVAKNLSDLAEKGPDLTVHPEFKRLISEFIAQNKPVGAICISPAVLVGAVRDNITPKVTVGSDPGNLITTLGGEHQVCKAAEAAIDDEHNIVSCPAYMVDEPLADIATGIEKLVEEVISRTTA